MNPELAERLKALKSLPMPGGKTLSDRTSSTSFDRLAKMKEHLGSLDEGDFRLSHFEKLFREKKGRKFSTSERGLAARLAHDPSQMPYFGEEDYKQAKEFFEVFTPDSVKTIDAELEKKHAQPGFWERMGTENPEGLLEAAGERVLGPGARLVHKVKEGEIGGAAMDLAKAPARVILGPDASAGADAALPVVAGVLDRLIGPPREFAAAFARNLIPTPGGNGGLDAATKAGKEAFYEKWRHGEDKGTEQAKADITSEMGNGLVGRGVAEAAAFGIDPLNLLPVAEGLGAARIARPAARGAVLGAKASRVAEAARAARMADITREAQAASKLEKIVLPEIEEAAKATNAARPEAATSRSMPETSMDPTSLEIARPAPVSVEPSFGPGERVARKKEAAGMREFFSGEEKAPRRELTDAPVGNELKGPIGREVEAHAPHDPNVKFKMRYRLESLDDLKPSHTDLMGENPKYPKEIQPRDRSRMASKVQVEEKARTLNADSLLNDAGRLDEGPPITGADAAVESGNGRTLYLRRARAQYPEKWLAYQEKLKTRAVELGFTPEQLAKVKDPVLVRERMTAVDRPEFARLANERPGLEMGTAEKAKADAARLPVESLQSLKVEAGKSLEETLRGPGGRDFVKDFMNGVPLNERAGMVTANGEMSLAGANRIKAALFSKVYTGPAGERLLSLFAEAGDELKNVSRAMMDSLPGMAEAESLATSGARAKELSIAPDLAKSVDKFAQLRREGIEVGDFLAQEDFFGRELTPFQEKLLVALDDFKNRPAQLREWLNEYAEGVKRSNRPGQSTMFGAGEIPSREKLLGMKKEMTAMQDMKARVEAHEKGAVAELKEKADGKSTVPDYCLRLFGAK